MNKSFVAIVVAGGVCLSSAKAQVTLDVTKITCEQYLLFKVVDPDDIALWLSGYFNGKRNNTVLEAQQFKQHKEQLKKFCETNFNVSVMQAAERLFAQ